MLRIQCPYCGERDYTEFTYGGDASGKMPDLDDDSIDYWVEFVMLRDNPKGMHAEYWQHQAGCREWLRVVRDTVSHLIESVAPAREAHRPPASRE